MKWIVLFVSVIVFNTAALLMPKRLKPAETYATTMFALFVDVTVDAYASARFRAWGFFEVDQTELSVLWIILGIYPAATVLIINGYPYKSRWGMKLGYILGWSIFSTAYEWLTLKVGILWHIHWNLFLSFVIYPLIYYMLIIHVRSYRWLLHQRKK